MNWWQKKEKSNYFWLKLSVFLAKYTPNFILNFIIFIVTLFFYIFLKEERKNIKEFYIKRNEYFKINEKFSIYSNFYNFGISIIDKFKVLQNKKLNLIIENKKYLEKHLLNQKKGSIIIISHFGNPEIARDFSKDYIKLHILLYSKHASSYIKVINELSENKINYIEVSRLDINAIVKMSDVINKGEHIVIMGDRASLNDTRNSHLEFLGQKAFFAQGAFLLASILKTKAYSLWCIKNKNKYFLEFSQIADDIMEKNKIDEYIKIYIKQLEEQVKKHPKMWFNFYNYWE